ncbi:hypothetical protein K2P56_01225 [Patescibacteria group bacterium]|nr:hypothetical protein [Patescibacteria group bacterium]
MNVERDYIFVGLPTETNRRLTPQQDSERISNTRELRLRDIQVGAKVSYFNPTNNGGFASKTPITGCVVIGFTDLAKVRALKTFEDGYEKVYTARPSRFTVEK